jgi:hypothetical protein
VDLDEAMRWLERHHTASGSIKRATDGHVMCDEDEHPYPCPAMTVLEALRQSQAGERGALAAAEAWMSHILDIIADRRVPSMDRIADGVAVLMMLREALATGS